MPSRSWIEIEADLTVVGGGMAAICAAVAAARHGCRVSLVQDRPVLGGNSSSECRVWVNGATGGMHNRYAREGGIMEEILLENKHRNPEGNAHVWDTVLLDLVKAESGIRLFLNTPVSGVEMAAPGRVAAVTAHQLMSERSFRFSSPLFFDGSGDGVVAAAAGASFHRGREARAEFGETWAPETADAKTLGDSIMFYSKDAGHPVTFRPPAFAKDFKKDTPPVLAQRADPKETRCCYWWLEYGGEFDTIADNDLIRDSLWAIVYGAWDYIKNSGRFSATENLDLEWVGSIPGKRESRRFLGDHVLTEQDLMTQRAFPDVVAHGGWSIDLHPPKGVFDERAEGSRHWHADGPYQVPLRCLYSKDLENVFLGGRMVSASHVAFGSLRVQMTLAVLGQAAGTAAALCKKYGTGPRGIHEKHLTELQQLLLRDDQWLIGVRHDDPADLAPSARATASSAQPSAFESASEAIALQYDSWFHIPQIGYLDKVEILVEGPLSKPWEIGIWRKGRPENYRPQRLEKNIKIPADSSAIRRWLSIPLDLEPDEGKGLYLALPACPGLKILGGPKNLSGVLSRIPTGPDFPWHREWLPCFRLSPDHGLFGPQQAVNGWSRPYGTPNAWLSKPVRDGEIEWLELEWDAPREIRSVQFVFNSNLTPWYNSLMPQEDRVPEIVQDYVITARVNGVYKELCRVTGNYQRLRRHVFAATRAEALRISVSKTGPGASAEIQEIRVYNGGSFIV